MLPAGARVRRSEEFSAATRGGRTVARGVVVVHLLVAAGGSVAPARAGFVVGRGVGGAVERNRVRRRLRHLAAPRLAQLPLGSTLVVRARPGAAAASWDVLGRDLDAALRLLGRARR